MNENDIQLLDTIKKYLQKYLDRQDVPTKPPIKLLDTLAYYFIQSNDLEGKYFPTLKMLVQTTRRCK